MREQTDGRIGKNGKCGFAVWTQAGKVLELKCEVRL